MIHGLHHVAIGVPDLDAGVAFYREAFGCEVEWQSDYTEPQAHVDAVIGLEGIRAKVAMLIFGEIRLELWEYLEPVQVDKRSPANGLGYPHIAVLVTDIDAEHQRLGELGVTFAGPPVDMGIRKAIYCTDPFGNIFELYESVP